MRPDVLAGFDLGPNYLQKLSTNDTNRKRLIKLNMVGLIFKEKQKCILFSSHIGEQPRLR